MLLNNYGRGVWAGILLSIGSTAACARDWTELAPATPEVPWAIPSRPAPVEAAGSPAIDPRHRYELPELIDLAQRLSPKTREAWERARQAALAVGLTESEYLPQLSAEAIGGFQRTPLPIPSTLVRSGYFTVDTREIVPSLTIKWLLFDFGRRDSAQEAAREKSFVANVAFTGEHQRLVFAVSRDFYALSAAVDTLKAANRALNTAEVDLDAVAARRQRGLATVVDLAQAERQRARAQFNAVRAQGVRDRALATLLATIGLPPLTRIEIADLSERALPADVGGTAQQYLTRALSDRPDILAAAGKVRAAQAELQQARKQYRPTISLAASAYGNIAGFSTDGSSYSNVAKPGGAVFLQFSWPIWDGGRRDTQAEIAHEELRAAQAAFEEGRDAAGKEVVDAYIALETGLAEQRAALTLTEAARTSHSGALESYQHGVGTYTTLIDSENAFVQAESDLSDARANVLSAAAALAFATGHATDRPDSRN